MSDHYDILRDTQYGILGTNLAEVGTDCISRQAAITQLSHNKNKGDGMKERLIEAEAFKKYCRRGFKDTEREYRSGILRAFAKQITEDFCKDIDEQPTVEAIPLDWIRQQAEQYPGMESAMWDKLLRMWEKEKTKAELYGGE